MRHLSGISRWLQVRKRQLNLSKKKTYDLVITDLVMGRLGGIDVLREAKNISPDTLVTILTGYGDISPAIDALRLHADDYLLKPCEDEEMAERVKKCLETVAMKKRPVSYTHLTLPTNREV